MAKSEARRQKQLAKKKAKRVEKRSDLPRSRSELMLARLAHAQDWPIVEALVPEGIWDGGIGTVVLTRQEPGGRFAFGVFLVDVWCLGVKNAFCRIDNGFEYNKLLRSIGQQETLVETSPEHAAKLVLSAVEYAQSLGFPPHEDYRQTKMMLAGIDPSLCPDTFTFGKDGKPYYFRGPRESLAKANMIAKLIAEAGGDYVIPMKGTEDPEMIEGGTVHRIFE